MGLIYMNARCFVPAVGRFASADALVPDPARPGSFNRYGYVLNAPLNLTDPSGHAYTGESGPADNCLSDPDDWASNFITYLMLDDIESNPIGMFILNFFWRQIERLTSEELGSKDIVEEVARGAIEGGTVYVSQITDRRGIDPTSAWQMHSALGDAFIPAVLLPLDSRDRGLTAGQSGRYNGLKAGMGHGSDLVAHHMPQRALNFTTEADGGAILLTRVEHFQTRTFGWRGAATARTDAGRPFREVLASDIQDIRGRVGN
ncbi:MAG: RHS repeat-associated core domain-containing protein [Candidatus Promineifilaceae bacterium]